MPVIQVVVLSQLSFKRKSTSLKNCKYWSSSVMTKCYAILHISINLQFGNVFMKGMLMLHAV